MTFQDVCNSQDVPQRVALITAGSAGLGAQIARCLAPDFRVVRLSNLPDTLEEADVRGSASIT